MEKDLDAMYDIYLERRNKKKGKPVKVRIGKKSRLVTIPDMDIDRDVIPSDKPKKPMPLSAYPKLSSDPFDSDQEEMDGEDENDESDSENEYLEDENNNEEIEEEDSEDIQNDLIVEDPDKDLTITRRAADWFSEKIFEGAEHASDEENEDESLIKKMKIQFEKTQEKLRQVVVVGDSKKDRIEEKRKKRESKRIQKAGDFEIVPVADPSEFLEEISDEETPLIGPHMGKEKLSEALAIGTVMASSGKAKQTIIDSAYNRYAFNDDDLPAWYELFFFFFFFFQNKINLFLLKVC